MKSLMQLRLLSVLFLIFCFIEPAEAAYISALFGPKSEVYKQNNQSERSRLNPVSIFLDLGLKLRPRFYLSVGASGEFDLGDFKTKGFTLSAFTKYFLIGVPDLIKTVGRDARVEVATPYTAFIGLGLFQKNIKFDDDPTLRSVNTNIGGLGFAAGGSYNISKRYYVTTQLQYLVSGPSTKESYSSMEAYAGAGFRF